MLSVLSSVFRLNCCQLCGSKSKQTQFSLEALLNHFCSIPTDHQAMKTSKKSHTRSMDAKKAKASIASTKSDVIVKKSQQKGTGDEDAGKKTDIRKVDVLLGRGNGIATWVGNKNFRRIVDSYKGAYKTAYRMEKSLVAEQVIHDVLHEVKGRFIEKKPSGDYIIVAYERALEKTCQCLREKSAALPTDSDSEESEIILQSKRPKKKRVTSLADEEISKPKTPTKSSAKRKVELSPLRPTKKAKTKKATQILPSVTVPLSKGLPKVPRKLAPKKEPRVPPGEHLPKVLRKNAPKKDPRVPPKVTSNASVNSFAKAKIAKAKAEKATQILPSVTVPLSKGLTKVLRKLAPKKEPRVPPGVVNASATISNAKVADSDVEYYGPTVHGTAVAAAAKNIRNEPEGRVQKLVDRAIEKKSSMQSHHGDLDDIFNLMPPNLTTLFSGIVSLSERSIHAVLGKAHPGADFPAAAVSTPARGKSLAALKQFKIHKTPYSPTNVADFDRESLETIFEPMFEASQSTDFALDLLDDSCPPHWSSHGYMG
jgi:hypothetical protein